MPDCRNWLAYTLDSLSRQTTEKWYNNLTNADVPQNVQKTYTTTYDEASRVASIGDGDYDFDYTYSIFGNLTSTTQDLTGLTDDVEFSYGHDVLGRKTSVSAAIGTTDDYVNAYSYDNLGRITQITQDGVTGGNAVAEKRVDYAYSDDATRATISRFADLAGTKAVAETEKVFDELGRVTDVAHERAATAFADYDLMWDAAGRITDIDFDFLGTAYDDDASYDYDDTSQLTDADYTTQTDEDYVYDDNGNRTLVDGTETYTTGDHNRLASDGTYYYTYDSEGNRTGKYSDASHTTPVETYFWDHRNRLTKTELYVSGQLDKTVEYAYGHDNRMYSRIVDATSDSRQIFVRSVDQILLELKDDNVGELAASDLNRRALWQPDTVDQLLAEEHIGDDTYWMLPDHLGTVRDIVSYDSATDTTTLEQHNEFTSFGILLNTPTLTPLALYTGRFYDSLAEKQYNRERWYDLSTGQWMSMDPIGFDAGDVNLYRYVGNCPVIATDPLGLFEPVNRGRRATLEDPSIKPDGNGTIGGKWEFIWHRQDLIQRTGLSAAQRVSGSGLFVASSECCMFTVDWEEAYVEVWTIHNLLYSDWDNHQAGPKKPANHMEAVMDMSFSEGGRTGLLLGYMPITSWSFEMEYTFTLYNGTYPTDWGFNEFHKSRLSWRVTGPQFYSSATDPSTGFNSMLYPRVGIVDVAACPPPTHGRKYVATDKWKIRWEEGMTRPETEYTTTDYR